MRHLGRVLGYGFATWVIALALSFLAYPLKKAADPLFETVMTLVVTTLAVGATGVYFRGLTRGFARKGVLLGVALLAVNVVLDQPLFLAGPMAMPFMAYMRDIGLTYLVYPVVTIGTGLLLHHLVRADVPAAAQSPAPEESQATEPALS